MSLYFNKFDIVYGIPKYSRPPAFLLSVDDGLVRSAKEIEMEKRLILIGCGLLLIACEALIEIEEAETI